MAGFMKAEKTKPIDIERMSSGKPLTLGDQIKKFVDLGWSDRSISRELYVPEPLVEGVRNLFEFEEVKKKEGELPVNTDISFVKLSLEDYEEMKRKISQQEVDISYLESEVKRLTDALTKLSIPAKIINKIGSDIPLSCCWQDDLANNKRKYRIDFEVDPRDLMGE